jgi:hypothetical protein
MGRSRRPSVPCASHRGRKRAPVLAENPRSRRSAPTQDSSGHLITRSCRPVLRHKSAQQVAHPGTRDHVRALVNARRRRRCARWTGTGLASVDGCLTAQRRCPGFCGGHEQTHPRDVWQPGWASCRHYTVACGLFRASPIHEPGPGRRLGTRGRFATSPCPVRGGQNLRARDQELGSLQRWRGAGWCMARGVR